VCTYAISGSMPPTLYESWLFMYHSGQYSCYRLPITVKKKTKAVFSPHLPYFAGLQFRYPATFRLFSVMQQLSEEEAKQFPIPFAGTITEKVTAGRQCTSKFMPMLLNTANSHKNSISPIKLANVRTPVHVSSVDSLLHRTIIKI